ncbi:MAG: hypothetical protein KBC28_00545 [Alphaproteobacteria bacterium]|jgi:type IV pilus biogenesis protein CpaD/CtpE|nr:hypothetical protein [Alphaproteobacteria bacterium]
MKIYKLSFILFFLFSGCTPKVADWTPAESPKENKVERAVFNYTLHYPAHESSMNKNVKKNFLRFLKANIISPSAVTVTLEEFGGHSEERIKDIERELLRFGIPYEFIVVSSESENESYHCSSHKHHQRSIGSGVEIIVERYVVIPPSCADFSQPIGDARQAYSPSNFACADTANFGMMIANPRDLIKGRPVGAADGTVMAAGVYRFRTDATKPLMDTSTNIDPGNQTSSSSSSSGGGGASSGGAGGAY